MSAADAIAAYRETIETTYRQRTPRSAEVIDHASQYVPDGDMRISIWYNPYPTVMDHGDGCHLVDVDGNDYLDFSNNWTSTILGNTPAAVIAAICRQAPRGSAMAAPNEAVFEWARMLCERIPSVERVRFCTSGTEAVMFAVRAARAFTGKDKILKMEGNYHGSYDMMEMQVGWRKRPPGIPHSTEADTLVTPFNDAATAERLITENKDELAAVIVEGIMGAAGMIPPENDYLKHLKRVAGANGVLLIIDEVISFRLAPGGAQTIYGVAPDLTALGKTIGGGLPVGAFGGRADVMAVYSPKQKRPAHHAGTFVASPIAVAAGIAGLEELTPAAIERINALGRDLRAKLQAVLDDLHLKLQIKGYGSLQQLHFTAEPVRDAQTAFFTQDRHLLGLFHLAMMNKGIFMPARGFFAVSTPMTETETGRAVNAAAECLAELKPLMEQVAPQLVG